MTTKAKMNFLVVPDEFEPPIVKGKNQGITAFHSYDWYFRWMERFLADVGKVFLTPCAATKPIHTSPFHRRIYQKFAAAQEDEREILVVSEPVVLIRYEDLYKFERLFCYDFPPKLLNQESRTLFVERLRSLLLGKDIAGCLPWHHATLINDAVGKNWENYWRGDIFSMIRRASLLTKK